MQAEYKKLYDEAVSENGEAYKTAREILNATKEAKRENKTAPEGTTFVVKAHAFADGNEFMLLSEK